MSALRFVFLPNHPTAIASGKSLPNSPGPAPSKLPPPLPLEKVVVEAKRLQAGLPSDKPPRKARDPRQDAVHAVMRLLEQVPPEQRIAWLETFSVDVELALAESYGKNAPMD